MSLVFTWVFPEEFRSSTYICIYIFFLIYINTYSLKASLAIYYLPSTICLWDVNHQLNRKANKNTLLSEQKTHGNVNLHGVDLCWNQMYLLFLSGIFGTPLIILECLMNFMVCSTWMNQKKQSNLPQVVSFWWKILCFTGCETMEFSQWSGPEASRRPGCQGKATGTFETRRFVWDVVFLIVFGFLKPRVSGVFFVIGIVHETKALLYEEYEKRFASHVSLF